MRSAAVDIVDNPGSTLSVLGHVSGAGSSLVHVVRAVSAGVCQDHELGRTTTDCDGNYRIEYERSGRVDLRIEVLDGDCVIARSAVLPDAGAEARIDVVVGKGPLREPTELERVRRRVTEVMDRECAGTALEKLSEEQLVLLALKAGATLEQVRALAASVRLAGASKLPADVFYALWRQGLPLELSGLASTSSRRMRSALEGAAARRIVGPRSNEELDHILSDIEALGIQQALDPQCGAPVMPLGAMLDVAKVAEKDREAVLRAAIQNDRSAKKFLDRLRADASLEPTTVARMEASLHLASIAQGHMRLVGAMVERDIGPREIAKLTRQDLEGLVRGEPDKPGAGAPPGIALKDYVDALDAVVELTMPTQTFAHRLSRSGTNLPEGGVAIASFLAARPDIELERQPLFLTFQERPELLQDQADREGFRRHAYTWERAFHMAPKTGRAHAAQVIVAKGMASPGRVHRMGSAAALKQLEPELGRDVAEEVVRRALMLWGWQTAVVTALSPRFRPGTMASTSQPIIAENGLGRWAELFGTLDHCSCEHCASVLGPGAYFADLVGWLGARTDIVARRTDGGASVARRPDILGIELSCKNASTPVPYVDLVNELLEHRARVAFGGLGDPPAPRQTTWSAAELLLQPEHLDEAAYVHLRDASRVYPFDLPFDLRLEEARAYLGELGLSRAALLRLFHAGAVSVAMDDRAVTTEILGLSVAQRALIEGTGDADLSALWGIGTEPVVTGAGTRATALSDLDVVETLLLHAGTPHEGPLSYDKLTELLRTRFVTTGTTPSIELVGASCALSDARLAWGADRSGPLDRMHRFLRLDRHLAWGVNALDRALTVLGGGVLDARALDRIAHVAWLCADLGLEPLEVLSWWGSLDTMSTGVPATRERTLTGFVLRFERTPAVDAGGSLVGNGRDPDPSFYERVTGISSSLMLDADDPRLPLQLRPDRTDLRATEGAGTTIMAHASVVATTLRLRPDDLALLLGRIAPAGTPPESVVLGLDTLSALYRYASLARALGLSVKDLVGLLELSGAPTTLFDLDGTAALVAFVQQARLLVQARLDVRLLDYVIADRDSEGTFAPTSERTMAVLADLHAGLARLTAEEAVAVASSPDSAAPSGAVSPEVLAARRRALAIQILASAVELEVAETEALVTGLPGASPGADWLDAFVASTELEQSARLRGLDRVARVLRGEGLRPADISFLLGRGDAHSLFSLARVAQPSVASGYLGLDAFLRLRAAMVLRRELGTELFDLVESSHRRAADPSTAPSHAESLEALARLGKWPVEEVAALAAAAPFRLEPDAGWSFDRLTRLAQVMGVIERTGATSADLTRWASNAAGGPFQVAADNVAALMHVARRHHGAAWAKAGRELRDGLREKQRNALLSALVGARAFADVQDLFGFLLIDVEMSPCQLTSRLRQAIGSLQLFVQRAFLDQEATRLSEAEAREWEWRKSYRVWEANRKVFLYPENWLEPAFRDDKTPFFEELESKLLQAEPTEEAAADALYSYVARLDEVASLDVRAMCHDPTASVHELHVVARTRSKPHKYFYRRRECRRWTPWEPIEVGVDGDHLLATVFRGKLHLLWPEVFEVAQDGEANTTQRPPARAWEIGFAWTRRDKEGWLAKQTATEALSPASETDATLRRTYFGKRDTLARDLAFSIATDDAAIKVRLFRRVPVTEQWLAFRKMFVHFGRHLAVRDNDLFTEPQLVAETLPPEEARQAAAAVFAALILALIGEADRARDVLAQHVPAGFVGATELLETLDLDLEAPFLTGNGELRLPHIDDSPILRLPRSVGGQSESFALVAPRDRSALGVEVLTRVGDQAFFQDAERTYLVEAQPRPELLFPGLAREEHGHFVGRLGEDLRIKAEIQRVVDPPAGGGEQADNALDLSVLLGFVARGGLLFNFLPSPVGQLRFESHHHPFAAAFGRVLERGGPAALYDGTRDGSMQCLTRQRCVLEGEQAFGSRYGASFLVYPGPLVPPVENIDFSATGAYAIYNWELFFHIPLLVADTFRKARRFEEALRWFHYIFDPRQPREGAPDADEKPRRYWKLRPFYELSGTDGQPLAELLATMGGGGADATRTREEVGEQVRQWLQHPFQPHAVARVRPVAYQTFVVMRYLDTLIEWGDSLFRLDTLESVGEAAQLYVLAAELLGRRPETVNITSERARSTSEILESWSEPPFSGTTELCPIEGDGAAGAGLLSLSDYFCVPVNERVLDAYWGRVADRLFKVRHCLDIQGRFRQLPLFEPPIDPLLLIQAHAAGADLSEVLAGIQSPPPHYRYEVLLQRALDLCGEVRSLGGSLLAAIEKRDAEKHAKLRAGQEIALYDEIVRVREQQILEAEEMLEATSRNAESALERAQHYFQLLHPGGETPPTGDRLLEAGARSLFDVPGAAPLNASEKNAERKTEDAQITSLVAQGIQVSASILEALPKFKLGSAGMGASPVVVADWGPPNLAAAIRATAGATNMLADVFSAEARASATRAQYERRKEDWQLQGRAAASDFQAASRNVAAQKLRVEVAKLEKKNAELQRKHAEESRAFLDTQKLTNEALYQYQLDQLTALYFQTYQLAHGLAKQAEKAWQREIGAREISFIDPGYWDRTRAGLLAGERLHHDLKRMEIAYLEHNRRELELTRHVSLRLLNPTALAELRAFGRCIFHLPEELFDLDSPGHYFRRIRQVSVSIPSVAGPYVPVRATLRLVASEIRVRDSGSDAYPRSSAEDARFVDVTEVATDTIVTSRAHEDAGLFDGAANDGRCMPFEGAGAISTWELRLPEDVRMFDYGTISDVLLHLRYSARHGSEALRTAAASSARSRIDAALVGISERFGTLADPSAESRVTGLFHAFSLREQFPDAWRRLVSSSPSTPVELELPLTRDQLPYAIQGLRGATIDHVRMVALLKDVSGAPITLRLGAGESSIVLQETGATSRPGLLHDHMPSEPDLDGDPWRIVATFEAGSPRHLQDLIAVVGFEAS